MSDTPISRAMRYAATGWLPPIVTDGCGWLWRRVWFRWLLQAACVIALLAAVAWGTAMWWTGRELEVVRAAVAAADLPTVPSHIPMPVLVAKDNGEPYVRAAQMLLGRWDKGYYQIQQPEAGQRLYASMSDAEWRCTSSEDRTVTLAFLEQPQRQLAWSLLGRASDHEGVVFPSQPLDEASLMLPQRAVLTLARLRIRLLADAGRQSEADIRLASLVRLVTITVPPPDAVSYLAWHDTVNGAIHLLKRLVAEKHLGESATRVVAKEWEHVPAARDLLLRLADAERLRLDRSLMERTPLLDPLPPENLTELAAQAVIGGAVGDWLGEPLRRHIAARLMADIVAVRAAIIAAQPDDTGLLPVALPPDLAPSSAETWRFCIAHENKTRCAIALVRVALALYHRRLMDGVWPEALAGLAVPVPVWVRWQRTADGGSLSLDERIQDRNTREALAWTMGR